MRWDPGEYLRFADERARPFVDLLARVRAEEPQLVVDLGCGPGNLTALLADRWPHADVEGIDSSPEMVERAARDHGETARFVVGDLTTWAPRQPVDVLTSNATLQWVPGHLALLPRLLDAVRPGGWLAFQVPGNFGEPTHATIAELLTKPRWAQRLAGVELATPSSEEPATYLDALAAADASAVDVWETTYLQVLDGDDAVVRWMTGTGLRPVLGALDEGEQAAFLDDYRELVAPHYPRRDHGTVLPYRRIFAVAQR